MAQTCFVGTEGMVMATGDKKDFTKEEEFELDLEG